MDAESFPASAPRTDPRVPPSLAPLLTIPLVGRQNELGKIEAAFREAAGRERRIVLIAGEPGVGKTRLTAELAARLGAREERPVTLYGRCDEQVVVSYQPFVEALRHHCSRLAPEVQMKHAGRRVSQLARIIPEIADISDVVAPPAGDDRYLLFDGVDHYLRSVAQEAPVVLILDDLHWAESPTMLLLSHLVRAEPARLLIVGTYRPTDVDLAHPLSRLLADLRREPSVTRVELSGLNQDEVANLLQLAAPHPESERSDAFVRALHDGTEGNPFFLHAVLNHLKETGKLYEQAERWTSDATSISELGLPASVREAVGQRISRLSPRSRQLLEVCSAIGRDFDLPLLERTAGLPQDELYDAIDAVTAARLIESVPGLLGRHRFTHALVQEAVYGELSTGRRVRTHQAIGEALERMGAAQQPHRLAELARHFGQIAATGDYEKAVHYADAAGAYAVSTLALEDAIWHWRQAEQWLCSFARVSHRRAELMLRIARVLNVTMTTDGYAREVFDQLVGLCEALEDEVMVAQARVSVGRFYQDLNRFDDAQVLFERAEPILRGMPDTADLAQTYLGLASHPTPTPGSEFPGAVKRAMEIADNLGDPVLWLEGARRRLGELEHRGRIDEARELGRTAVVMADNAESAQAWRIVNMIGQVDLWMMDPVAAAQTWERELNTTRTRLLRVGTQALRRSVGLARAMLGQLDEAERVYASFIQELPDGDLGLARTSLGIRLRYYRGEWREAAEMWLKYGRPNTPQVVKCSQMAGEAYCNAGEFELSESALGRAVDIATRRGLLDDEAISRIGRSLMFIEARRFAEARADAVRASVILENRAEWRGVAARLAMAQGALAIHDRDVGRGNEHFQWAANRFHELQIPWDEAEANLHWGKALKSSGRPRLAAQRFDAARSLYERIGAAPPWHRRLDAAAGKVAAVAFQGGLSDREVQVLTLIARGWSNQQIADELIISPNTVARHVSHIFAKLGVANRAEATARALTNGMA